MAGRTNNKLREYNREALLQGKKEWYEKNKEQQSENMKNGREQTKTM